MIMTIIILLLPDYNFYDLWFVYDHSAFLLTIIMIIIINENSHIFRQKLLWDDRLLEDIGEVFKQSLALNIIYLLLDELFVELYENLPAVIFFPLWFFNLISNHLSNWVFIFSYDSSSTLYPCEKVGKSVVVSTSVALRLASLFSSTF